jgi:hypothetical protein
VGAAKRATAKGPVFITNRGRPAYALLRIEDYLQLSGYQESSLLDLMDAIPGGPAVDFKQAPITVVFEPADLS